MDIRELTVIDGDPEPRVRDIRLAEALEFARPRKIRDLIERNEAELERYAPLPHHGAMVEIGSGAQREATEYWLTEAQALLICMRSDAPKAADVRAEIIAVFQAWRQGRLVPAASVPATMEALRDLVREEVHRAVAPLRAVVDDTHKNVLRLTKRKRAEPTEETMRFHEKVISLHPFNRFCPCGACEHKILNEDGSWILESGVRVMELHHQNGVHDARAESTIPLYKDCHDRITRSARERNLFAPAFDRYQHSLSRIPFKQLTFKLELLADAI